MTIQSILKILSENAKDITKLTTGGAKGKNGKGADSIAVGAATPYKQSKKENTPIAKKYPAVANVVQKLKDDSLKGNQVLNGAALAQVKNLMNLLPLEDDENGDTILPFGNNIRLKNRNGIYYIGFKEETPISPTK